MPAPQGRKTRYQAIVIDSRPGDGLGPWSEQRVLGRTLLSWHLDAARAARAGTVRVVTEQRAGPDDAPKPGELWIRTDRLYDPRRLRRAYRSGQGPESAVIWRFDSRADLESAASELRRRLTYQPIGRFWAGPLARSLAGRLRPTWVRPNHLTLLAAACMGAASALVAAGAAGGTAVRCLTAILLALALVLDTADGHLARIQATASEFGRWLDVVLDELCDYVLHIAIGWAAFQATGRPVWLLAACGYATAKSVFQIAQYEVREQPAAPGAESGELEPRSFGLKRQIVHYLGHADVRWHSWIVFAALGRLDWLLVFGAAYFWARVAAIVPGQAVRHA